MLSTSSVRLTRTDCFLKADPFEGSVPFKDIENQVPLFASRNIFYEGSSRARQSPHPDPWAQMTTQRLAKMRCAHASCWSTGPESEAMWRLYCCDEDVPGQGVAVQCTFAELAQSLAHHDLLACPIIYRTYHEGPVFAHELDSYFHKRRGFQHEQEVRFLKYNSEQYGRCAQAIANQDPEPTDLPEYLPLAWPAARSFGQILISPYASVAYEASVKSKLSALMPGIESRIELSELSERRYPVQM